MIVLARYDNDGARSEGRVELPDELAVLHVREGHRRAFAALLNDRPEADAFRAVHLSVVDDVDGELRRRHHELGFVTTLSSDHPAIGPTLLRMSGGDQHQGEQERQDHLHCGLHAVGRYSDGSNAPRQKASDILLETAGEASCDACSDLRSATMR